MRSDLLKEIKKDKEEKAKRPKRNSMTSHLPYYAMPCLGVT